MRIGVPKELKDNEARVALTPSGVRELTSRGHTVVIESLAGRGSAFEDSEYNDAGANLVSSAAAVWDQAEMVMKVKEPVPSEYGLLREGQIVFTYLHLAADRACADALIAARSTAIAYETVQTQDGSLPLLAPMSEVAGRLAVQVGAFYLMQTNGGRGVLMGGVPGTPGAKVVIIGAGVSGQGATAMAVGLHADVVVLDRNLARLRQLDAIYQGRVRTIASTSAEIEHFALNADLVVGAVLVPGALAPKLIQNELVARMKTGSVLVDIAIDQGGCFEASRPTTHTDPTFQLHGSVFYCVANMPGAVARTSTLALTSATLPYATAIACQGWRAALSTDPALALGLNACGGRIFNQRVGTAHGYECLELNMALDAEN